MQLDEPDGYAISQHAGAAQVIGGAAYLDERGGQPLEPEDFRG